MRRRGRLLLGVEAVASFAVALLAAAGCGASSSPRQGLAPTLRREMTELVGAGVPGVVVLVRRDGRTLRLASGEADLARKTPMRTSDRFRIGSITKTFVATVVLQLVGEGELSLDDTVERWLPGLVPNGERITVRQLLGHRSGLFDYLDDPRVLRPYLHGDFGYVWTPRRLVAISASHPPLFPPGTGFSYSNTNYVLLGLVVEAATRRPIGLELDRLFGRLGLRATSFDTSPRIRGPHAHGYLVDGSWSDVSVLSPSPAWAAGAIVSTADDVASFYRALLGGHLLPPDLLRTMETTEDGHGLGLDSRLSGALACGASATTA